MIYEYSCDECGYNFDVNKPIRCFDRLEYCPKCHKSARKLFSVVNHTWGNGMWQWGDIKGTGADRERVETGLGDEYVHNF